MSLSQGCCNDENFGLTCQRKGFEDDSGPACCGGDVVEVTGQGEGGQVIDPGLVRSASVFSAVWTRGKVYCLPLAPVKPRVGW